MDFRVERESADGIWGRLAAELDGRGLPDPWAAVREIRLRPLHAAIDGAAGRELIDTLASDIRRGRRPKLPADRAALYAAVSRLSDEHRRVSGDSDSRFSPENVIEAMERRLAASSRQWRLFGRGVRRKIRKLFGPSIWDESGLLALWAVLTSLTAVAGKRHPGEVRELWDLGRWILSRWPEPDHHRIAGLTGMLLSADGWNAGGFRPGNALPVLMADAAVREVCGVNSWDGVMWYDRDGWYDCVRALGLTAAADIRPGKPGPRRRAQVKKLLSGWHQSDGAAEYHLDRLLSGAR
jgi:hypothetical protein